MVIAKQEVTEQMENYQSHAHPITHHITHHVGTTQPTHPKPNRRT